MAFRPSQPPLLWPALFGAGLAKKAALYGLANAYGLPRAYRRLLELERRVYPTASPVFRQSIRQGLKQTIRFPNQAASHLTANPAVLALIAQLGKMQLGSDAMRTRMMEVLSAVLKAAGVNEKELWQQAKEEEKRHTKQ